ncbi:hypothetical protein EGW08_021264 [Elysia chlorotica]|uniref:Uncharacterized protein n=1 Tax=Elysia chlorotica TaxID=188477 RepID=A0A433SP57_ELYCH|nr:hypothetical protein EGW08_021264 [Elysia chlorotica]
MASRTAAKTRYNNLSTTADTCNGIRPDVNKFDLKGEESDATVGIFPPLPSVQQNGTPALSLFRRDDTGSVPTSPSAHSGSSGFWEYGRVGTVSHTALGLSALPQPPARYALLSLEPDHSGQCSGSSQYYQSYGGSDRLASPRAPPVYTNGQPRRWGGAWGGRTGQTCVPAGLTGLLRPSVLLRSSWRKLTRMERPKLYSLVGLVVQSSVLALTMRYSRTSQDKEHRYSTPSAVVISEMMKVIICILAMAFTARKTLLSQLSSLSNTRELVKCSVPALLYTVQNNLLFVAVTYLDAATFQVTYQLKILTTAVFSVCFLRRKLDIIHWSALVMLTCGVGLVQATLGLLTALVMKYADNIIKGFASSIAIVITTFVSSVILVDLQLSCSFLVGASVVMGSALLYNVDRNGASDSRNSDGVV